MHYIYSVIQSLVMVALLVLFFVLVATTAYADANDGEYLGYRLGERYIAPRNADTRDHINGAQIFDLNPGAHPHHVDTITLFVSPISSIIGTILGDWYFQHERAAHAFADRYLAQLEQKYPHWKRKERSLTYGNYQLWVEVEERPYIVEHWPSDDDYRVGIGLIYAPDSRRRGEWMAMIDTEVNARAMTAQQ